MKTPTDETPMPISRFPVPNFDDLPDDLKAMMLAVQEKAGFIPNVFLTLAWRPDELRAFMGYHDALMERDSGLTKAEREMIVVATSAENRCAYCVVAHGAILRVRANNALVADQITLNYRKADITDRQKIMLEFAVKVANASETVNENDYQLLAEHEFSESDIWDITGITAFFGMSNRIANVISMRPNDEFYSMGRAPKI